MYQLRNKLNRTNVVNTPKKDVNACEDFIETLTCGQVVTATISILQLKSANDHPSEAVFPGVANVWSLPSDERKKCLKTLCTSIYDKFIKFSYNSCSSVATGGDKLCEYSVQLLRLGCFYMEFADAIREGDGRRVLRCWKYMVPIFSASGNTNYACEAANLLIQHNYSLSPRMAAQLSCSRFVNVHGRPGKNIPVDLHMEHLNKIAKGAIRLSGSNKNEKTITRIGRAIGTLSPALEAFDAANNVTESSSSQKKKKMQTDIQVVATELVKAMCFVVVNKDRKHYSFSNPKDLLKAKDKTALVHWLITKLPYSL